MDFDFDFYFFSFGRGLLRTRFSDFDFRFSICTSIFSKRTCTLPEALKTKWKVTSIVSFSSSISTTTMIQKKYLQAGSSLNILTWQQMIAKEELAIMIPALQSFLAWQNRYLETPFHYKTIQAVSYGVTISIMWRCCIY
jgi:hypothetical protein